ncbi:uncharacterized protein ACBT57_007300 [Dama dama]
MRATAAWQPRVPGPSHSFLAAASKPAPFQGTLTQKPSALELERPEQGRLGPGLEVGPWAGASSLLPRNPSLKQQLVCALGLALSKAMGLFGLMVV